MFLVEGEHLIQEAYQAGFLKMVLSINDLNLDQVDQYIVSKEIIDKLSDVESNQGMIGVCHMIKKQSLSDKILMLDRVQDPGNIGTLMRSAVAFGFETVIFDESVDIYNPKVIRSSQGAIFKINYIETSILDFIKEHQDIKYYVTVLNGKTDFQRPDNAVALILGNEGSGVRQEIIALADENIKISMHNTESLNVGVAGSILMYEFGGRR